MAAKLHSILHINTFGLGFRMGGRTGAQFSDEKSYRLIEHSVVSRNHLQYYTTVSRI